MHNLKKCLALCRSDWSPLKLNGKLIFRSLSFAFMFVRVPVVWVDVPCCPVEIFVPWVWVATVFIDGGVGFLLGGVGTLGVGETSGCMLSSDLVVPSGELRDICCPCGDIGVSVKSSSGRLGNQVPLGLPVDGTLASLGVPGLDRVPKFLYVLDTDSCSGSLTCSLVFPLSGFVSIGFFTEK